MDWIIQGGNNHGSICYINSQWYIFYHRMTNNTVFSRRSCVEKIQIAPDGTIAQVPMTSLGFEEALNPYMQTPSDIACVLKGGAFVSEHNEFSRVITNIQHGCVIGYKYFDFGYDNSSKTLIFAVKIRGVGCRSRINIILDDYKKGEEVGICSVGMDDQICRAVIKNVTGHHALFLIAENITEGWGAQLFLSRQLFEIESFVFTK